MSYPDQDSAGGTLHISCLTHPPSVDAIPALKQLRRSFSRSPAQSSPFRLHTNSTIPSAADTSLSPLALMRALSPRPRQREMTASDYLSPKAPPTVPATRKIKLSLRRAPPFRSSPRCRGSPTDKIRPALHNATNRANSTPSPLSLTSSEDEEIEDISPDGNENFDPKHQVPRSTKFTLNDTPIRFDFAKPKLDTIVPVKSSPLKRADLTVHPDEASFGSPVAKRRSLHAATLVLDSDCQVPYALPSFVQSHHNRSGLENENNNFFASSSQKQSSFLPKPFSLRKSTLQQRYSSNVTSSPKSQRDCSPHPTLHLGTNLRTSHRHSLDSSQDATIAIFQSPARPDLSKEPTVPTYQAYTKPTDGRPHPLSNSTTPLSPLVAADAPSTKSSLEDDSYKASFVFSKSLPIGALRPQAPTKKIGIDDDVSYATPKGYKIAKPLPAAFMSTGLISKRNRQMDDHLAETFAGYAMPDTPSKRSSFPPVKMISPMRQSMIRPAHNPPEFGTPTTPLSPYSSRSTTGAAFGKGVGIFGSRLGRNESQRKSSFASIEGDDVLQSPTGQADSQSSNDDLPPTPTKHAKVDTRNRSYGNSLRSSLFGRRASLAPDSFVAPSTQEQPLTNSFADGKLSAQFFYLRITSCCSLIRAESLLIQC